MDFIRSYFLSDLSICDKLIEYYKNSKNKFEGALWYTDTPIVDKEVKDSIDAPLFPNDPEFSLYLGNLQLLLQKYIKEFKYCNEYYPWYVTDTVNIQYYPPGCGFKAWHCERNGNTEPIVSRHMVFMTYLNDVTEGGETQFYYQKKKIKPKKGLTVIWPADWTYTHRGIPSMTQEKYIVTGWYNFCGKK